jgi:hypothetical protein
MPPLAWPPEAALTLHHLPILTPPTHTPSSPRRWITCAPRAASRLASSASAGAWPSPPRRRPTPPSGRRVGAAGGGTACDWPQGGAVLHALRLHLRCCHVACCCRVCCLRPWPGPACAAACAAGLQMPWPMVAGQVLVPVQAARTGKPPRWQAAAQPARKAAGSAGGAPECAAQGSGRCRCSLGQYTLAYSCASQPQQVIDVSIRGARSQRAA